MPKIKPFEENSNLYEDWFERNQLAYQSELQAVRSLIPADGEGVEIGIGSGRFAVPFGIRYGVEPSRKMISLAVAQGLHIIQGTAESLPLSENQFDFVLMVTTICFVDDLRAALLEARRILRSEGRIVIGFVDKDSLIGKMYEENKSKSVFYRDATFYSVAEVIGHLSQTGFGAYEFKQTIFRSLDQIDTLEPVTDGYGQGSFVVIRAQKKPLLGAEIK